VIEDQRRNLIIKNWDGRMEDGWWMEDGRWKMEGR